MECPDYEIINWRSTSIGNVISELCKKDGVKTVGFEQDHLTFGDMEIHAGYDRCRISTDIECG